MLNDHWNLVTSVSSSGAKVKLPDVPNFTVDQTVPSSSAAGKAVEVISGSLGTLLS